jgi:photosystem II stability/assembly factor-like uncharacterized protein
MADARDLQGLLEWRCIGPFRGGRVVAVAGDEHDRNVFYFGAVAGGVWKTTDAGTYWECVSDGFFKTSSVGALAVASSDSNVIYAGTGETTIRIDVSHGDGVYKSTDAGRTWQHVGLSDTRHIGKIRIHPTDPDTVYVAALGHAFGKNEERGVFKSTDGGANWRKVLYVSDKAGAVDLTMDPKNPRVLYAAIWEAYRSFSMISSGGPESGIWRSTDGGETWANITENPGLPKGVKGKIGISASPAKSGRVWALIEHRHDGGLYRSDDMGNSWERVSDNQHLISRAWYYTHVTADPVDPETVYINNLALWRSNDGGKTFVEVPTAHGDNHDIWIDPRDNQRMIQGNDGGAGCSFNGGETFSTLYNQPTAQLYHIATDTRDPYHVYGTQQDNSSIGIPSRTARQAILWGDNYIAGTGESGYIVARPDDPNIVYVGAIGSSPGGGNSLQRYDHRSKQIRLITTWPEYMGGYGASEHKYRFAWTYPIVISPHDPNTLYIGGNMVFRSTNEGQSWEPISPDLTVADPETLKPTGGPVNLDSIGAEIYATVFALVESPHEKGVLWAGSDDGLIHISKDGGNNWAKITPPELPPFTMISCIELSPFDKATAYVAGTRYKLDDYQPYLYKTTDYGASWTRINNGIPDDDFTRVVRADPVRKGLLYAGTETGLYISYDDGANWARFQLNLPVSPIHDLLVKDDDLIAGTHGRSIWILDDLTPLRQGAEGVSGAKLFAPRRTLRPVTNIDWSGNAPGKDYIGTTGGAYITTKTPEGGVKRRYLDAGANPPAGAIITYHLDAAPGEPITLVISDAAGAEVRKFQSRPTPAEDGSKPAPDAPKGPFIPANAGYNRFVWDLRHDKLTKFEGSDPPAEVELAGPRVAPGSYTITLTVGEQSYKEKLDVIKDPVIETSNEELQEQYALAVRIYRKLDETVKSVNRMRDLRGQLAGWAKRAKNMTGGEGVQEAATALRDKVLEIEKRIIIPDLRSGWADNLNNGVRLFEKLAALTAVVELGDYRPTDVSYTVFEHLASQIDNHIAAFNQLVEAELPALNKKVSESGWGALV